MSNSIIEVKADSDTRLFWRLQSNNDWVQLTPTVSGAPTIATVGSRVTYEFVKYSGSANPVLYKPPGGGANQNLPTSGGPTLTVSAPDREQVEFAKNDSAPTFYIGFVQVDEGR